MAALLERFYEPQVGVVKLDGRSLRELDPSWLRGEVLGYISQEPVLFACSVRENIRYGRPSATDQEVEEAAKLAYAHPFIREFPHGYDTLVGERGVAVSGGQKQRYLYREMMSSTTMFYDQDCHCPSVIARSFCTHPG